MCTFSTKVACAAACGDAAGKRLDNDGGTLAGAALLRQYRTTDGIGVRELQHHRGSTDFMPSEQGGHGVGGDLLVREK